jgi:phosphoglycerate dehydrogenase-like enzyme
VIRIAILDDYQNAALGAADWASLAGCTVEVFDRHLGHDEAVVADALRPFQVIVAMRERTPFPASLLAELPELRLLITTGMRNLAIDLSAAKARGIVVSGTAMVGHAAAEHAWALIMALARQIPREDRAMHAGGWQEGVGIGLAGKTLGLLGLGRLGAKVARVGLAFEMEVIAWSANLGAERAAECGARRVEKDELFRRADLLSIHLVLSARSRGLVGAREFALMKPSAYLINTSRGPIVDEAALVEALRTRRIAGAGLDVYDTEPLPADHPLRALDNAVLTGHTGYVVQEMYPLAYGQAVENVRAWQAGAPIRVLSD